MKDLIIIGAGGFGRELLSYAIDIINMGNCNWRIKGFIDDNINSLDGFETGYPLLGSISDHSIEDNAVYICAIGDGKTRLRVCEDFYNKGAKFVNFIHPTAKIRERVLMGVGNIFCPNTWVNPDTVIGNFVLVNVFSGIAHDCIIGDACSFMGGNSINGNCTLGQGVFLGSNALIVPRRRIGDYAQISAGAVVFTNVKSGRTMLGNPAKILK